MAEPMPESTAEEQRAALIYRLVGGVLAARDERHARCDYDWEESKDAETVLAVLESEGRLVDPGDVQECVGIVLQQLRDARAEIARLQAARFDPGLVVRPAPIGGGWAVLCLACEASTLIGLPSRDAAVDRAERHQHVYPDDDGFVPAGAWPKAQS